MSNPARELHDLYSMWASDGQGTAPLRQKRGWSHGDDPTADYTRAMSCLVRIDNTLGQLEKQGRSVRAFRNTYPRWVQILVLYPNHWGSSSDDLYPQDAMTMLDSLASYFEIAGLELDATGASLLRSVIDAARDLLDEDDSLPEHLRAYITVLINGIEEALEQDGSSGGFDYAAAVHSLWLAFGTAASTSQKAPSKWKEQAMKIVPSVAGGILTHYGIAGLDLAMKAIGS